MQLLGQVGDPVDDRRRVEQEPAGASFVARSKVLKNTTSGATMKPAPTVRHPPQHDVVGKSTISQFGGAPVPSQVPAITKIASTGMTEEELEGRPWKARAADTQMVRGILIDRVTSTSRRARVG